MAAADGFRLSVRKATLSAPAPAPISVIVPARVLTELARVASDGEETISMVTPKGRGQVVFHVKDVEVVSQLIDGTFPDYQQIIPRKHTSCTLVRPRPCSRLASKLKSLRVKVRPWPAEHQICECRFETKRS